MKQVISNQVAIMKALQLLLGNEYHPPGSISGRTIDELTSRILESEEET